MRIVRFAGVSYPKDVREITESHIAQSMPMIQPVKPPRTGYHLALQYAHNKGKNIDDADSSPVSALPGTAAEIYKLLHEYFPVKYAGIAAQAWHDALCSKISQIDFNLFPQVEYDLEPLWRICPNVHRFIKDQGGDDQSPEAILAILDPETENEPEEFRHERKCLHKLLAKNFALYRLELGLQNHSCLTNTATKMPIPVAENVPAQAANARGQAGSHKVSTLQRTHWLNAEIARIFSCARSATFSSSSYSPAFLLNQAVSSRLSSPNHQK